MNVTQARTAVQRIRKLAREGDWEGAHSAEDELHQRILESIAEGAADPVELANIALGTKRIVFQRVCA